MNRSSGKQEDNRLRKGDIPPSQATGMLTSKLQGLNMGSSRQEEETLQSDVKENISDTCNIQYAKNCCGENLSDHFSEIFSCNNSSKRKQNKLFEEDADPCQLLDRYFHRKSSLQKEENTALHGRNSEARSVLPASLLQHLQRKKSIFDAVHDTKYTYKGNFSNQSTFQPDMVCNPQSTYSDSLISNTPKVKQNSDVSKKLCRESPTGVNYYPDDESSSSSSDFDIFNDEAVDKIVLVSYINSCYFL